MHVVDGYILNIQRLLPAVEIKETIRWYADEDTNILRRLVVDVQERRLAV